MKDTAINFEEKIDKIAGRRRPPANAWKAAMELQATLIELKRSLGNRGVPRGVYRFKTHEEADEWLMRMLAKNSPPAT